jgi:hypothetical protein
VSADEELKRMLVSALYSLQKLPGKIMSFFEHPDTRYALANPE